MNIRQATVAELRNRQWLAHENATIKAFDVALVNEDDFDAPLTAAAWTRMFLNRAPFESPETTDVLAEGGAWCRKDCRRRPNCYEGDYMHKICRWW